MSQHQAFRRQAVPAQVMQKMDTTTIPAPTRGLVESENYAYMQPGGAVVLDNWKPTLRGIALRGGCTRWCDLHHLDAVIPPVPDATRKPVVSSFEYSSGNSQRMFAAQQAKLFDVTFSTPTLVKSGQNSGNYSTAQFANMAGDWLIVVNDAGDYPLRYNGVAWETLDVAYVPGSKPSKISGPPGSTVVNGGNLTYVCKYRGRLYFIEGGSMNAWYLPIDSVGGMLQMIPLSGAATKGGRLLFCATWSVDAGDGIDDKLVFCTTKGELLIFTGSNPSDAANWRQEGRYQIAEPMGMNAHVALGGDLLIATVDGIVPISASISKDSGALNLAMITQNIRSIWRSEVADKRDMPWSMCRWDEYGGIFVTWPGGRRGNRYCAVVNNATGAWARYVGYDATCFMRMRQDMFFGTQDGIVMQADRTGYDDGAPYVATMVGGWEMFHSPSQTVTWRQARAAFVARNFEPFVPQISACTDYVIDIPPPPPPGFDSDVLDLWDQGNWDQAKWDQYYASLPVSRNTMWVSVGITGFFPRAYSASNGSPAG